MLIPDPGHFSDSTCCVDIVTHDLRLSCQHTPFGAVAFGALVLKGQIQTAEWKRTSRSEKYYDY
jgi:hypothetical protein